MSKQEFFLLIPAIIYGVAIVDLLKVFGHRKNYIEIMGWGIYVMLAVIYSWTELYFKLELITNNTINFYLVIIQAIILAMLARLITPEEKDIDTKVYFFNVRKSFFILASVSVVYNVLLSNFMYHDRLPLWIRLLGVVLYLVVAFSNKFWLRITILAFVLTLTLLIIFTSSITQ